MSPIIDYMWLDTKSETLRFFIFQLDEDHIQEVVDWGLTAITGIPGSVFAVEVYWRAAERKIVLAPITIVGKQVCPVKDILGLNTIKIAEWIIDFYQRYPTVSGKIEASTLLDQLGALTIELRPV
jgi:hypothetical protein